MRYEPQYLGEIDLSEETLAHYGVKGMKWRRRIKRGLINVRGRIRKAKRDIGTELSAARYNSRHPNGKFSRQDIKDLKNLGEYPSYGEDDRGYPSSKGNYSHKLYISDINNSTRDAAVNRERRSLANTDPRYKKRK